MTRGSGQVDFTQILVAHFNLGGVHVGVQSGSDRQAGPGARREPRSCDNKWRRSRWGSAGWPQGLGSGRTTGRRSRAPDQAERCRSPRRGGSCGIPPVQDEGLQELLMPLPRLGTSNLVHLGVAGGGVRAHMPKDRLQLTQVHAQFQPMGLKTVPLTQV